MGQSSNLVKVIWLRQTPAWLIGFCLSSLVIATGKSFAQDEIGFGDNAVSNPLGLAQRESLQRVWYRGNPLPPKPTAEELEVIRALIDSDATTSHERRLLERLYPGDLELLVYAHRDTDGDGIFDYRISNYLGKFREGDLDLDGDGVDNYFDSDPYDPDRGDPSSIIPSQLDWANNSSKTEEMVAIQIELFWRYHILLVERDARFTPALARATKDALSILFDPHFPDGLPTLKVIATEASSLLLANDEEEADDFGQIFDASKSLSIYQLGIEAPTIIKLGLLVHELSHAIQHAMDYDPAAFPFETSMPEHFLNIMADFGWTTKELKPTPNLIFKLFQPHYTYLPIYESRWNGLTVNEWRERWSGSSLQESESRELGIIGLYALGSPSEWYADHVISYLYISLMDAVRDKCSQEDWNDLAQWLDGTIAQSWPDSAYSNARGVPFQSHLEKKFPISPEARLLLAERYLDPQRFCSTSPHLNP